MAKTKISEFSSTPGNNTDIDSINIAEGCAPSGINDAIRELMAQLKDFQAGTAGDSFNGPVGTTTAAAGAFTTLSASGAVTLSGGTANGVAYLNGSKVLTTGSALTFDGASLRLANAVGTTANGLRLDGGAQAHYWYLSDNVTSAYEIGSGSGQWKWLNSNGEQMRLTSTGLGIGTSSITAIYGKTLQIGSGGSENTVSLVGPTGSVFLATVGATGQLIARGGTALQLGANDSVHATLSTSGNLGLGVTPSAWWSSSKAIQIGSGASLNARTNNSAFAEIGANVFLDSSAATTYIASAAASRYQQANGGHFWYTAPSGTAGNAISFTQAMTLDASGNLVLGTTATASARLYVRGSGTTSATSSFEAANSSGATRLYVQDDGTTRFFGSAGSETARIDSSGNLLVGSTTNNGSYPARIYALGATPLTVRTTSNPGNTIIFMNSSDALAGYVNVSGTTTTYNSVSDYRLKNIIGAVTGAGERIDALEPVEYEWKSDGSRTRGFLAHKFQEVYAGSVTGSKDEVNAEGKPVYQAMQASSSEVIADLVAEIKSLRQRLAAAGI